MNCKTLLQHIPPVLNWWCWLTEVDPYWTKKLFWNWWQFALLYVLLIWKSVVNRNVLLNNIVNSIYILMIRKSAPRSCIAGVLWNVFCLYTWTTHVLCMKVCMFVYFFHLSNFNLCRGHKRFFFVMGHCSLLAAAVQRLYKQVQHVIADCLS